MINLIDWLFVVCVVHWISRSISLDTSMNIYIYIYIYIFQCTKWQFSVKIISLTISKKRQTCCELLN